MTTGVRTIGLIGALLWLLTGCKESGSSTTYIKVTGETMGTYYNVTLNSDLSPATIKDSIDQLLVEINDEVSTYIETSIISRLNQEPGTFTISDSQDHFAKNLDASTDLYETTRGYFDPTVMPLVNYWGFGYTPKRAVTQVDSTAIDSMMQIVGLDKLSYRKTLNSLVIKPFRGQLDFSAIAKGYGVDQVGALLERNGVKDYYVEIGGEVLTHGQNSKGGNWVIGINTPSSDAALTDLIEYLMLTNRGLASSGNYRNYHEVDGAKYGHTINPKTGYPEVNELLAVSVIARDCMTADAIATACMVMGYTKAKDLIASLPEIEACFFTGSEDGSINKNYSHGFIQYVATE
jgi:thiamine biosynthesis lipoprotein